MTITCHGCNNVKDSVRAHHPFPRTDPGYFIPFCDECRPRCAWVDPDQGHLDPRTGEVIIKRPERPFRI